MNGHNDHLGALRSNHLIDSFLDTVKQILKQQTIPKMLWKPGGDVGIVEPENGNLYSCLADNGISRKIQAAVPCVQHIARKQRNPETRKLGSHPVIYRMPRFYVVVSESHHVIPHIFSHTRINVWSHGIYKVVVIGNVVTLKYVTCINQQHIVLPDLCAETVNIVFYRHQRVFSLTSIGRYVEITAVHIACRDYVQGFLAGKTAHCSGKKKGRRQ